MMFERRVWKIFAICVAVGVSFGIFDWRYATGVLLGSIAAMFNWFRSESFWNQVLDAKHATKFTGLGHFVVNYSVMAIALVLCAKFPAYLNIFACTFALFFIKISLMINEITKRGGSAS